jgi:transposase
MGNPTKQEVKKKKKRGRTAYTDEFRREAVRLVENDPSQIAEVARGLGIHPETLHEWYRRSQAAGEGPIVPPTHMLTLEEENRRLRRENARLTEERDILKKATAFFARDAR